jgi:hypothetical protein
MRFRTRGMTIATLAMAIAAPAAAAQPEGRQGGTVHQLTLEQHPEIPNGRIAMVEGEAGADGVRLVVSKLSILQPVGVLLAAVDPQDDLQLSLWKYAEDDVARQGSTRGSGAVSFQLRTEDDLQIRVVSPEGPKRYRLAVWAGDEVDVPVPSPFVSQAGVGGASGGTPPILYVLTAGVLAIAVFLGMMVMRRKKA